MSSTSDIPEKAITGLMTSDVTEKAMGDHTMSDTTAEASPELSSKEIWESSLRDLPNHTFRSLSKLVRSIENRVQGRNSSNDVQKQTIVISLNVIPLGHGEKAFVKVSVREGSEAHPAEYCFLEDPRSSSKSTITLGTAYPIPAQHNRETKQLANVHLHIREPIRPRGRTRLGEPRMRNGPFDYYRNGLVVFFDEPAGEVFNLANGYVDRMRYTIGSRNVAVMMRDGTWLGMTLENERDAAGVADHIIWSVVGPREKQKDEAVTLYVASSGRY